MQRCPECGDEVTADQETCASCGARLDARTEGFPTVMGEEAESSAEAVGLETPVLVVKKGPEVGQRFRLDRDKLVVGRDPESDIFLNDITVSREHAVIDVVGGAATVSDSDSLNGTYVNGARVLEAPLHHGDAVQIGRFQMVYLSPTEAG